LANGTRNTAEDAVLTTFFNVMKPPAAGGHHDPVGDTNTLMTQVFCPDNGVGPVFGGLPAVAITEHGTQQGPGFFGAQDVSSIFTKLFTSFPDCSIVPLSDLRLYAPYANPVYTPITIGVQVDIKGTFSADWFKTGPHASNPLSAANTPTKPYKAMSVPAVTVFTFTNKHQVQQLAVYMDRYHFMTQLSLATPLATNQEITKLMKWLTSPERRKKK
jgi:hypothetical protein